MMSSTSGQRPTLVVIAKDEARCIARCLDSARLVTDRMLVLDTGSKDATPDIARACGAEVHFFDWIDDFSAARNRALELAGADWNLILDADEWLQADGALSWSSVLEQPRLGLLRVVSIDQSSGQDLEVSSWQPRLLPGGVRYEGRIHEQPSTHLPRLRTGLSIFHDGYMKEQMQRKRGRNRALIEHSLAQSPQDPYLLYQLGTEHEGLKAFAEASRCYRQALEYLPRGVGYEHPLLVRTLHCLCRSGAVDEALALIERFASGYDHSPDFHFAAGNAYLDKGLRDPGQAVQRWLPQAVLAWQRCLAIGDQPELEGSMQGRGSFLAAFNLHVVFEQLGEPAQAAHYKGLAAIRG
jgi:glycosyltransferase involved in cell wall biosynthesis